MRLKAAKAPSQTAGPVQAQRVWQHAREIQAAPESAGELVRPRPPAAGTGSVGRAQKDIVAPIWALAIPSHFLY